MVCGWVPPVIVKYPAAGRPATAGRRTQALETARSAAAAGVAASATAAVAVARRKVRMASSYRRSEEHTSELQSLMRISYAVFCLKKKKTPHIKTTDTQNDVKIQQ